MKTNHPHPSFVSPSCAVYASAEIRRGKARRLIRPGALQSVLDCQLFPAQLRALVAKCFPCECALPQVARTDLCQTFPVPSSSVCTRNQWCRRSRAYKCQNRFRLLAVY